MKARRQGRSVPAWVGSFNVCLILTLPSMILVQGVDWAHEYSESVLDDRSESAAGAVADGRGHVYAVGYASGAQRRRWESSAGRGRGEARDVAQSADESIYAVGQGGISAAQDGGGRDEDFVVVRLRPPAFIRGDCNGDGRFSAITDALFLLRYFFMAGHAPECTSACDANADGDLSATVADPLYLLFFAFSGGPPPPAPFPGCVGGWFLDGQPLSCDTEVVCSDDE